MVDDYYAYSPTVVLEQPIAIIGFAGARVSVIAAAIVSLTGLPLIDLDRWIEHEVGASLAQFVLRKGEAALRATESLLLLRALDARPAGILALGEGAVLREANLRQIREKASLIYVELDIFELYARIKEELAYAPGKYLHLFGECPQSPQQIKSFLDQRVTGYRQADWIVRGSHKAPLAVAAEIRQLCNL
jgi:shikimate kinase